MSDKDLKVTFESEKTVTLELHEDKGVLSNRGTIYRFNQADQINDIVSDISLYFLISTTLGWALFRIIEDWLEGEV